MIMQNSPMSRETRKFLSDLGSMAEGSGITTLVVSKDIYTAEMLVLTYYSNPIMNVVKSRVKVIKSKSSKHFSPVYWVSIIEKAFSNNSSVLRENSTPYAIDPTDNAITGFDLLRGYLLTDYSIMDSMEIVDIAHKYDAHMLKKAIDVAKGNNVYNINYVKAVIEKEQALTNMKKQGIEKLEERTKASASILNKEKVSNTMTDLATAAYNWEQAQQNADIERKMREAGML